MKLKDVKVGEEYEYLRSYDKLPIRSKVTKIGVPLRYYSFGGVELLIESPNGPKTITCPARCLSRPWAEVEQEQVEQAEAEAKRLSKVTALNDYGQGIDLLLRNAGIKAKIETVPWDSPYLEIRIDDLANVITLHNILGSSLGALNIRLQDVTAGGGQGDTPNHTK